MPIVRIEHAVPNFEKWKQTFDSDPANRKGAGVRRYQIVRLRDDPNYVMIDLEFDGVDEAEGFLHNAANLGRFRQSGHAEPDGPHRGHRGGQGTLTGTEVGSERRLTKATAIYFCDRERVGGHHSLLAREFGVRQGCVRVP